MVSSSATSVEKRAQLLRELSQDLNKTRNLSASARFSQYSGSPDTTSTSFDPDNEALVSTRQLENSVQQLPELRASAQKYSRFSRPEPKSELDYVIDTSAIGRAFPDFTQGGSSSDDASVSIELGRGIKKGSGTISKLGRFNRSPTPVKSNQDDSFDFSAPIIDSHYITGTPPLANPRTRKSNGAVSSPRTTDSQLRRSSGLRNEIRENTSPLAKTKDYGSGGSRQGSENRQSLAAMHARVQDENDASYIEEDRAPTVDLTARSSRFSSAKHHPRERNKPLPAKFCSKQNFVPSNPQHRGNAASRRRTSDQCLPGTCHGTQSMVLPDIPNVSELVSGVFEDGTPVFSVDGKPRSTRFASGAQNPKSQSSKVDHVNVNEVEVPRDEQDIYLSLQLLQDKVDDLERIRAESELAMSELQHRNRTLEAEKAEHKRYQRSDSAIGLTDGSDAGDEMGGGHRKLLIEKNRLESSVRALSSQVETTERKIAVSAISLKNITKDRDSAVSQLGVAYVTIEQLKSQNAELIKENDKLKARLTTNNDVVGSMANNEVRKENYLPSEEKPHMSDVRARKQASESNPERSQVLNPAQTAQTRQLVNQDSVKLRSKDRVEYQASQRGKTRKPTDSRLNASTTHGYDQPPQHSGSHVTDLFSHVEETQRSVNYAESESNEDVDNVQAEVLSTYDGQQQIRLKDGYQIQDTTRDLTYLSFLENNEIAQLRRTLEQERLERKHRQAVKASTPTTRDHTAKANVTGQLSQDLPRKSSLKNNTRRATDTVDNTNGSAQELGVASGDKALSEHIRRHSETTVDLRRQQQRKQQADNMTSAFILPDITIRELAPELLAAGEKILNDLQNHDDRNCTVCHQKVAAGLDHIHANTTMETVTIPKPVPVSTRMPEPTIFNEDPTIRPSQPPALALATVLKGLEDELAHQKIQLAHYQKLYSGHDPALSKRQRKSVYAKIEKLMQAIDTKSDQIYSLYDVLEGQEQDGHQMTEREVEVTLQSIGVDVAEVGLRGGDKVAHSKKAPIERQPWDLDSHDGSEDELPWEGIESTTGTTKSRAQSQRRSWAT